MTIIQSVILGIVEGITEFLPVSSTGHLILTGKLLGVPDSNFSKSFDIAIQLGAILAVLFLYWRKISLDKNLWKKVLVAFIPTAVLGFLFYKVLKEFLLSSTVVVLWALFLGGIFLIIFEIWYPSSKAKLTAGRVRKEKNDRQNGLEQISYKKSFFIGVIQSLSIIPGVSRAGATIVGGLLAGLKRQTIVEFSFLLAVPTMAAATLYDLYKSAGEFSFSEFHLLAIGFITSFVVAVVAIKWLLNFIKNHTFISFGIYRIVVAVLFWIFVVK